MTDYDCTNDVMEHRKRVAFWISWICDVLKLHTEHHDESKLQPPEKEIFDEFTPKLKTVEFGSPVYKVYLEKMGEGLKHHYKSNPHHPEYFQNGIDGMTMWDVVEMLADWMAATSMKANHMDLDALQTRFNISPQLRHIIENTLWAADMEAINYRIPLDVMQIDNFLDSSIRLDGEGPKL